MKLIHRLDGRVRGQMLIVGVSEVRLRSIACAWEVGARLLR